MKNLLWIAALVLYLLALAACPNVTPVATGATWSFQPSGDTFETDLALSGPVDVYLVVTNADPAPEGWVAEDLPDFPEQRGEPRDGLLTDDVARIVAAQAHAAAQHGSRVGGQAGSAYRDVAVGGSTTLQGIGQPDKAAHLRAMTGSLATRWGQRTLKIWVADDCWTSGGVKPYLLTQAMVDAVADKFLREGADNDIYDWVTAIGGPEYGSDAAEKNPRLVPFNAEIHLFLYDLDDDSTVDQSAGWAGFFNAGDLYEGDGSNRNVFLHVDGPWLARPTAGTWDIGKGWPARYMAVIAHEFTHAVQFYRQAVLASVAQPAWMVEMIPQMMEDALSSRTADPVPFGEPRDDGASSAGRRGTRIAFYDAYPRQSFEGRGASWRSVKTWYAANQLFGGWLMRKFGGPVVLQRILGGTRGGFDGIVDALASLGFSETPQSLLAGWARAGLQSDIVGGDLNRGGWFPFTTDGLDTALFSQNYYHHEEWDSRAGAFAAGPQVLDFADFTPDRPLNPLANTYYLVGRNLTGAYRLRVNHPDLQRLHVLVVAKPSS